MPLDTTFKSQGRNRRLPSLPIREQNNSGTENPIISDLDNGPVPRRVPWLFRIGMSGQASLSDRGYPAQNVTLITPHRVPATPARGRNASGRANLNMAASSVAIPSVRIPTGL